MAKFYPPPKGYVEVLRPNNISVTLFRSRAIADVVSYDEVIWSSVGF